MIEPKREVIGLSIEVKGWVAIKGYIKTNRVLVSTNLKEWGLLHHMIDSEQQEVK